MMTHNTRPIQGSVCSKDMAVEPCVSKTKGSAFGIQALRLAASPSLLALIASMCVMLTGEMGSRETERTGETSMQIWGKRHIAVSALQTQLTALPVSAEEKVS